MRSPNQFSVTRKRENATIAVHLVIMLMSAEDRNKLSNKSALEKNMLLKKEIANSHHSSSKSHHHRNYNSSAQHHHYVNAIPSPSSRYGNSNRYINQSDLCTKIISGNYIPAPLKSSNSKASASSDISGSSSGSSSDRSEAQQQQNQKYHNHTSACCGAENSKLAAERSAIDNSMRCTLRRGRPNTPKTGLSVDYRIRKSSVPNTPECTHLVSSRINHTISSDEYKLITGEDLKKNLKSYIQLASNNASKLHFISLYFTESTFRFILAGYLTFFQD